MGDFYIDNKGIIGVPPGIPGSLPSKHAKHHITGGTDVIPNATDVNSGLMSPTDKQKLDAITQEKIDTWNTVTEKANKVDVYTKSEVNNLLGQAGYGDMMKATYDADNDGVVDLAKDADTVDGKHFTDIQNDAQSKADAALDAAKVYTNQEIAKVTNDLEYQQPEIVGTQIRLQRRSDTKRLYFKLDNDLTGGIITISLDAGITSKSLVDIDNNPITELKKGYWEVIEDAENFILPPRGGDLKEFFGDGSDGVLDTNSNVILECAQDAPLIKQYKSIKINAGHTLTTNNRCARLILYSQSDVVIDGIIDMNKKGWRYSIRNNSLPAVIYGRNKIAPTPVGGDGGNGGNGAGYHGGYGNIGGRGTTLGSGKGGGGGGGGSEAWGGGGSKVGAGGNGGSAEFTYTNDYNLAGRVSGGSASGSGNESSNGGNAINSGGGGGGAAVYGYTAAYAYGGYGGYGYWAGGGGGGGAASTASEGVTAYSGGNGENGGGNVVIIAKGNVIIGAGGKILCNGGNGGNGGTGSSVSEDYNAYGYNGGGGGGAGGGTIVILHKGTFINNGELSVAGGLGGSGGSGYFTGQNGTSGTVGTIIVGQITD